MGKKRQRSAASDGEAKKPAPQKPLQHESTAPSAEPFKKKHKKAPLQLKVIGVKAPAAPAPNKDNEVKASEAKPQSKTTEVSPADDESTTKKKKHKKNKNKKKANADGNGQEALSSKPVKASTEDIDDLFQSLKTKKKENAEAAEREKAEAAQIRKKQRKEREQLEEQIKLLEAQNTNLTAVQGQNPDPRPVRYDEDGLPIYSEEALQIGKGGGTADCPFDCWCCF